MIVISDTSCINYLVLIGEIEVLHHLYRVVIIPQAVRTELLHEETPEIVREWISDSPHWVITESLDEPIDFPKLHLGEREAIALALKLNADKLLMDDELGRKFAKQQGLNVTGTLGVLLEAANADLLLLEDVVSNLKRTTYRASEALYDKVLRTGEANQP